MDAAHAPQDGNLPAENDPTHDINGAVVVGWLIGFTLLLVISLYVLYAIFTQSVDGRRTEAINQAPTAERTEVFAQEDRILSGQTESGDQGMTIQQAMERYAQGG